MRKFRSSFVSAAGPSWLSRLFDRLFPPPQRVRREAVTPAIIYTETPAHVHAFRQRASQARHLLRLYRENKPATRAAWTQAGFSDRTWRKARRILQNAKVMGRDGRLLYTGRDAQLRLDVYLDKIEQMCWQSGRYVSP